MDKRTWTPHAPRRWTPSSVFTIYLLVIVASTALAVGFLCTLGGCSVAESSDTGYVSPYDWAGLEHTGDRIAYYEEGILRSQTGIDVSSHQGTIDWQAVATDGIDFAMIRVGNRGYTEGDLYVDDRFAENARDAQAAGMSTGYYFFSQAIDEDEAREEADLVIEQLQGTPVDKPIAFDQEPVSDPAGRANDLSPEQLTANARAFCDRIRSAGYEPMIYGNAHDAANLDLDALADIPFWFAEYDAATPHAQFDFVMWQYTNAGTVAGINTPVDMNILFLPAYTTLTSVGYDR